MSALWELTSIEAARQIRAGAISSQDLVSACIARIGESDDDIHAWRHFDADKALADALARVAEGGADAFYSGDIAQAIARTVNKAHRNPGGMKTDDIEAYKAKKRAPVCLPYRLWLICGSGPPSSGGITTLQILGLLQNFDLAKLGPGAEAAIPTLLDIALQEPPRFADAARAALTAIERK